MGSRNPASVWDNPTPINTTPSDRDFHTPAPLRVSPSEVTGLRHMAEVSRMFVRGFSVMQIAEHTGLDHHEVQGHLLRAREVWRERAGQNVDAWIAEQLAKLDAVENEAWCGWERSQKPEVVTTEETAAGDPPKRHQGRKTTIRHGAAGYLDLILRCIEARNKLLKLTEPDVINVSQDTIVEVVVDSREQVSQIMRFGQFAKLPKVNQVIDQATAEASSLADSDDSSDDDAPDNLDSI